MSHDCFGAALGGFRSVVGDAHVVAAGPEIAAAERATFATSSRVLSIVRPGDAAEVADCLRIANREGVPLYPISGGKNWGFGSRVPPRDAVLLDLRRLDRIVGYDEELGYVTVEPGVTFDAAYAFLKAKGSALMLNSTGASPKASLSATRSNAVTAPVRTATASRTCRGSRWCCPPASASTRASSGSRGRGSVRCIGGASAQRWTGSSRNRHSAS